MFATCTQFAVDGAVAPLDAVHLTLMQHQTTRLNADGFRVIAVAYKDIAEPQSNYRNEDESDLTLLGYIAFLDPPKVREWISSALASPDLVLEAQPPAQPHSRVVVEHPIRFAGGSNPKVVGPSAEPLVQLIHQPCGLLPSTRSVGQRVDSFDHALDARL